ncbi:MAG: hypothetical protein RMK29_19080 [Myxococcales bacterium]|nr:hypothetical protein [Myxococcota bacterium]MDW8283809.1 hypothetical protein [Myxococcales bacterium]
MPQPADGAAETDLGAGDLTSTADGNGPSDLAGADLRGCTLAAQWQLADELPAMVGRRTLARRIVADGTGKLWVSGQYSDNMDSATWLVRSSVDGLVWMGGPSFRYAVGQSGGAPALVRDRMRGHLLLAGWLGDRGAVEHWIVRRSTDGGMTFATVDDFNLVAGKHSAAFGVADDAAGAHYVAGYGIDVTDTRHWIVRRSTDGGTSWDTSDDFVYAGGRRSEALDVVEGGAGMLAIGFGNDGSAHRWIVRRRQGAAWATTDDYRLGVGQDAVGVHLAAAGMTVYAIGRATNDSGLTFWVVRRSTDGGLTWQTVDSYRHEDMREARGLFVYIDRAGRVYALGEGLERTGRYSWVVRRSTDRGATWQTLDVWPGQAGQGASPRGMIEDAQGNLLIAGASAESADTARWVVRRLRCE